VAAISFWFSFSQLYFLSIEVERDLGYLLGEFSTSGSVKSNLTVFYLFAPEEIIEERTLTSTLISLVFFKIKNTLSLLIS
tara:strand:- start:322 stop:561 length:240 start_codon:yes stop_codon:yes gene_type:complete